MKKQVLSRRKHLKRQFKKSLELKQDIAGYKPTLAVADRFHDPVVSSFHMRYIMQMLVICQLFL